MAEDEDKSSKTEEPTERKLNKARQQGNVPKSREVNNFFMMVGILLCLVAALPFALKELLNVYGAILSDAGTYRLESKNTLGALLSYLSLKGIWALTPTLLILVALALAGALVQTGFIFSVEPIKPKLNRISLIKGFERQFSMKAVAEFLKSVAKMVVMGALMYFVMLVHLDELLSLFMKTPFDMTLTVQTISIRMVLAVMAIALLIAVADFLFQKAQFRKDQRMSMKELKDEFKETEGDPHIKGRQRQIRMERARQRMMQEVPSADVVVTNPTHYAVALRYDKAKEQAPRVVAKGVDLIALRIRELALENDVPLYEDPPLARQLYADVELDDEIPLEMYEAVAQVIAFIFNRKAS